MKIARFIHGGAERIGVVADGAVIPTSYASVLDCMGESAASVKAKSLKEKLPLQKVKLLPPVLPSKILCLGWNYLEHIEELKHSIPEKPMVFLKPPSTLLGHDGNVVLPDKKLSTEVNNEVELAVVIGREGRNIHKEKAYDYVLGYTVAQDITARDIQLRLREKNEQWDIAKAFDTFAPLGPWIATTSSIKNPHNLRISLKVNGLVRQDSNTRFMIFKIPEVIEYLSSVMTLIPGDVISTGTPKGVDLIRAGDVLEAEIEGIGVLRNKVSIGGRQ
jgi:2-keto-4-pentenoate hydratase/2-oxohepta-3-ene-1,7-dioic acid hydratase in catechol pathway